MTTSQLIVTILGLAAVIWVNWYFFVAGRSAGVAAAPVRGRPEAKP